ncbi:hypothetical protein [Parafrankia sp. EUN1f]|uniref:hypothetical protein n=1 Tax=Parafrankia sp. EUN1f TaxID=102897 RepID=UPI001E410379|nr:hypothetical protein [Parafrankia sp. EUN1f]
MRVRGRVAAPILAGLVLVYAASPALANGPGAVEQVQQAETSAPPTESPRPSPVPIEVTPDWRDLPGRSKIEDLLDVAAQLGLVCCVGAVIVGGGALGIGRVTGSAPSGIRGWGMVLGGGGGALMITYAPDLIAWMTA